MLKQALDRIVWDKWSKGKSADIRAGESGFVMDAMPFKARMKPDVQDAAPFVYEEGGKSISFKPSGMWWTTPEGDIPAKTPQPSKGKLISGKVRYKAALGSGVDIEVSTGRNVWRKDVVIKSLASLGKIPVNAESLDIGFEIETDFDLEWDGKYDLQFNTPIALSEISRIRPISVRDSSKPEPDEELELDSKRVTDPCTGFLRVRDGKKYLVKRIPVAYLKQAIYPLITDATITYGSEYVFNSAQTDYIFCAALDSTHFVVGYRDYGGDSYGCAKIGTVSSGDEITYGSEYVFNSVGADYISCAALDSTHFVVGYRDYGGDSYGCAKIGTVSSGDEITYGSEYVFNAAAILYSSCATLDSTHFVVGYEDNGGDNYGCAKIGTVSSGDEITYGSEYVFNSAQTSNISCATLDSTHFVVGYRDSGNSSYGTAIVGVLLTPPKYGEVSISAAPSMIIEALRKRPGIAAISATPSLSALTKRIRSGIASLHSVTSLGAMPLRIRPGAASINAVPSVMINGDLIASAIAEIEAIASLDADGDRIAAGAIVIAVVASLYAKPANIYSEVCSINVTPSLTATGNMIAQGKTAISVITSLAALAARTVPGECSIQATASLVALAARIRFAEASISTEAALTAAAKLIASGKIDIDAVASMALDGDAIMSAIASIQTVPSLTADPARVKLGEASIESAVSIIADPLRTRLGNVLIDMSPSMTVDGDLIASAIAAIEASATLTADANVFKVGAVAIVIVSSLIAAGNLTANGNASIEAVASLIASGITIKTGEVEITARSSLTAAALIYIAQILGYTGTLTAGDVLEIDVDKMTVKLNGTNARENFTGTFVQIQPGDNVVVWTDSDGSRNVDLEVKHDPRYL